MAEQLSVFHTLDVSSAVWPDGVATSQGSEELCRGIARAYGDIISEVIR